MSDNDAVLKILDERREKIIARFKQGLGDSAEEIRHLLNSLNHPASYYASFTAADREKVRAEWTGLAASIGASLATKRKKAQKAKRPSAVLKFFGGADCIPERPRATDDYTRGSQLHSWQAAAKMRSIQLNPPAMTHWLIFDCDHPDVERWRSAGLPEPAFITVNPENGHHHVVYRLSVPVCTSIRGRTKPIRYLCAVREGLREALGGDIGYVGLLTKNPLHPAWQVIRRAVMPPYSLAELAETVDLRGPRRRRVSGGIDAASLTHVGQGGRNHALFDVVRCWAYRYGDSEASIVEYANECNAHFPDPLESNEVANIARSIARYCARGARSTHQYTAEFRARQAARGRRGGRPPTTSISEPWVAQGISRATWYRRERQKSLNET